MRLTKGKEVVIYLDVYNKTKPEGRAQLVTCLESKTFKDKTERFVIQSWLVRFRAFDGYLDPTLHTRRIRV